MKQFHYTTTKDVDFVIYIFHLPTSVCSSYRLERFGLFGFLVYTLNELASRPWFTINTFNTLQNMMGCEIVRKHDGP